MRSSLGGFITLREALYSLRGRTKPRHSLPPEGASHGQKNLISAIIEGEWWAVLADKPMAKQLKITFTKSEV
jgi:hypothetical protein